MGTLLVIIIILVLCWPAIKRWTARFMARRAEDFIRNATGMPPRPGSRQAKKNSRRQDAEGSRFGSDRRKKHTRKEPLIPKEYAEDVEFTETIDYSSAAFSHHDASGTRTWHESQVSDAEWVEVKKKN